LTSTLSGLVASYGLAGVLILMAFESCGFPFPSEVIMPTAGLLAAAGHMNLELAILAGAIGNLLGSLAAFGLAAVSRCFLVQAGGSASAPTISSSPTGGSSAGGCGRC